MYSESCLIRTSELLFLKIYINNKTSQELSFSARAANRPLQP